MECRVGGEGGESNREGLVALPYAAEEEPARRGHPTALRGWQVLPGTGANHWVQERLQGRVREAGEQLPTALHS